MKKDIKCPYCGKKLDKSIAAGLLGSIVTEKKIEACRKNAQKAGRKKIAFETKYFELNWDKYPDLPQKVAVDMFPEGTSERTLDRHIGNTCARTIKEAKEVLYGIDTTFFDGNGKEYLPGFPDHVYLIEE